MKKLIAAGIAGMLGAANAHAFGLGDLVNIGIQAGGELVRAAGGKAVDAIKESMRDPEAEAREKAEKERQIAEAFQKQVSEIEAQPGLRPIDRERLILTLRKQQQWAKQMQAFAEQAEARQKAERDKIFTASGFLGVVGNAALNTPSVALAQADAMTRNPVWRAEQRARNEAVFAQADLLQKSGINEAGTKAVMDTAEAMAKAGVTRQGIETVSEVAANAKDAVQQVAAVPVEAGQTIPGTADPGSGAIASPKDAFMPDLGRKLYVEFVGSNAETELLRNRLQAMGHTLVASREEAEVVYLVEGEYVVPETKRYAGITLNLGELLDAPDKPIPAPEKKLSGMLASGVSKFLLAAAGAQGQNIPASADQKEGVFRQEALLVIARQPKNSKETRFSVFKSGESADLVGAKMAAQARDELYAALGIAEDGAGKKDLPQNVQQAKE